MILEAKTFIKDGSKYLAIARDATDGDHKAVRIEIKPWTRQDEDRIALEMESERASIHATMAADSLRKAVDGLLENVAKRKARAAIERAWQWNVPTWNGWLTRRASTPEPTAGVSAYA